MSFVPVFSVAILGQKLPYTAMVDSIQISFNLLYLSFPVGKPEAAAGDL